MIAAASAPSYPSGTRPFLFRDLSRLSRTRFIQHRTMDNRKWAGDESENASGLALEDSETPFSPAGLVDLPDELL